MSVDLRSFDRFHKLLENERLLLVLADQDDHVVYLERLSDMDAAIQRGKPIKSLDRDEVGEDVLFAYDETQRLLSVCTSTKVSFRHRILAEVA